MELKEFKQRLKVLGIDNKQLVKIEYNCDEWAIGELKFPFDEEESVVALTFMKSIRCHERGRKIIAISEIDGVMKL